MDDLWHNAVEQVVKYTDMTEEEILWIQVSRTMMINLCGVCRTWKLYHCICIRVMGLCEPTLVLVVVAK